MAETPVASTMQTSLTADAELAAFRDALRWAKRFIITVTVVVLLLLGTLVGVGIESVHSSQQQALMLAQQIDKTVVAHNTLLGQTQDTICIVLQASPGLAPFIPKSCPPLSPKFKTLIAEAQAQENKTNAAVAAQSTELKQVLNAACILIASSPSLKAYAPAACKGSP